jgi:hypothetical protein
MAEGLLPVTLTLEQLPPPGHVYDEAMPAADVPR